MRTITYELLAIDWVSIFAQSGIFGSVLAILTMAAKLFKRKSETQYMDAQKETLIIQTYKEILNDLRKENKDLKTTIADMEQQMMQLKNHVFMSDKKMALVEKALNRTPITEEDAALLKQQLAAMDISRL